VNEIVTIEQPDLPLDIDPKLGWALRNMNLFPIDVNKADLWLIKRIPGIGVGSALKIIAARKFRYLTSEHLKKMGIAYNRAKHFLVGDRAINPQKDNTIEQVRSRILAECDSKYKTSLSTQMALF